MKKMILLLIAALLVALTIILLSCNQKLYDGINKRTVNKTVGK